MARWRSIIGVGAGLGAAVAVIAAAFAELRSARLQAALFGAIAREATFAVAPGPSDAIAFAAGGPYDQRLGYDRLPALIDRLRAQGYAVTLQARMSPRMLELREHGLYVPYREKAQAGLTLLDCGGDTLLRERLPRRAFERFEAVPPLLVQTLLFVEDRHLLDPRPARRNPALDAGRLVKAVYEQLRRAADPALPASGGSTLATQIEKYRHSPHGRTGSVGEKLRQIASASLRAYRDGDRTLAYRRQLVADYLDTVPLAARPGHGEVHGIGDGLWAWYGRDLDEVVALLADSGESAAPAGGALARQAEAYKQVLSLLVAQRRPARLLADRAALARATDRYLRLLSDAGIIAPALRDAALAQPLRLHETPPAPRPDFVQRKATQALRSELARRLGIAQPYDLERLDLYADSAIDGRAQQVVAQALAALREPGALKATGLLGDRLLGPGTDPARVAYSLTLVERGERAHRLRVQADSVDQPFDVNDGARLDLGSTAKLRTLVSYLEIVAELHERFATADAAQRAAAGARDPLSAWALRHLQRADDRSLAATLDAAMERRYSASPAETFRTGGGVHRFANFERDRDRRSVSVREAFRHSVNLVFIRLMRDIVRYRIAVDRPDAGRLFADPADPGRRELLAQFADREGAAYLARFHRRYAALAPADAEARLLHGVRASAPRLASALLTIEPQADDARLGALLAQRGVPTRALRQLRERIGALPLADRAYVARTHPLELWLVGYLRRHPGATLDQVLAASGDARQQAYAWLFRTRHKSAQDLRIRDVLEQQAFAAIHRSWRRLGYPFESLTPSYASAIGASGDRPAALAELAAIIASRGVRLPLQRVGALHFARDTPYETRLEPAPAAAERLLAPEVAAALRRALADVVERGTARRLKGALADDPLEIGGKTGTGDHRVRVGRAERVVARSATFVFTLGDRYVGTVMAYVRGPDAARYRFTSALPVQLLKSLLPQLLPVLRDSGCAAD